MQIWIYFFPGVGGDGFANLLEHARNVQTIDGLDQWRAHWYVDNQIKFYSPSIDRFNCFRNGYRFDRTKNQFNWKYLKALENRHQYLIVTSHDLRRQNFNLSDHRDILSYNYQDVFLTTYDYAQAMYRATIKNLRHQIDPDFDINLIDTKQISQFHDRTVYIEDVLSDWASFRTFCESLGLDMDARHFDHYHNLISGRKMYQLSHPDFGYYYSCHQDLQFTYQRFDCPQDIDDSVEILLDPNV